MSIHDDPGNPIHRRRAAHLVGRYLHDPADTAEKAVRSYLEAAPRPDVERVTCELIAAGCSWLSTTGAPASLLGATGHQAGGCQHLEDRQKVDELLELMLQRVDPQAWFDQHTDREAALIGVEAARAAAAALELLAVGQDVEPVVVLHALRAMIEADVAAWRAGKTDQEGTR